jgi:predicted MFS family arabinose efflux permease
VSLQRQDRYCSAIAGRTIGAMNTSAINNQTRDTPTNTAGALSRGQAVFMVAALVAAVISFMLNATMLSPAIRDINSHLGPDAYGSMSAYFYLAGAISNVALIRWSDYIGRKRVLLGVLVMLCAGTVLCIVGTSLPVVVAGRILQGASNITFGLTFLIMRERLSATMFGVCCGVISAANAGVSGLDALLAGFMVDRFGFRSIFVLTLVVGAAALALGWKAVPADESGGVRTGRMDWVGAALIALGVAGINLFLGNGGHAGWLSPLVLGFIVAAVVGLVAFVVVEQRVTNPLVRIDQLRSRYTWPLIAVTILCFASFMIVLGYIIPSIAEDDHIGFGASGQTTALLFITPAAAVQLIVSPLIGRLAVRIGFVTVLRAGLTVAIAVTALLAIFAFDKNMVILLMPVFGVALAATLTPLAALGVIQAPKDEPGSLPGLANAAFGIGGSVGFAWAGTVVAQGTTAGFETALWICTAIGVATLATSIILKPRPLSTAPDSMSRRAR